ncbi:MAG: hypothetical protein ACRCYE_10450 [Sarcina sp.]
MDKIRNLKVIGEMSIGEGCYDNISIVGEARTTGEVSGKRLKVVGELESRYFMELESANIVGEWRALDVIIKNEVNVLGEVWVDKTFAVGEIKITGEVTVKESLKGENLKVVGQLTIDGNCEFDNIKSVGEINVKGLMSADSIELCLYADCNIGELGGEIIKVTKKGQKGFSLFNSMYSKNHYLYCDTIEGENIILENTICKIVRGSNIEIGKGCKIDLVEATENLNIDKDSEVKETVWKKN